MFYTICGIQIIKNNKNFEVVNNYFSKDPKDVSSIKELNSLLDKGEYFIMIYPESSINDGIIRYLSEKRIKINLINKINKDELMDQYISIEQIFNSNYYKEFLNIKKNNTLDCQFFKENYFLPGIKEYYLHFKQLAESKGLSPEDAIYNISREGETYFYDIIDPFSMNKIYGQREKNGKIKSDIIHLNTLQFRDNLGIPYKVENFKELVQEMKINKEPISCLFSEYDENTSTLKSGTTYFKLLIKLYYNKAKNEDILVVTDKSGSFKKRNHKPLFIIILDISGSMSDYHKYLQNQLIPKLLRKLGYEFKKNEFYKTIVQNNISNLELLQAIRSKKKLESFLKSYNLKQPLNLKDIKDFSDNIIPLITFSDDSELYFFDVSDFEKCYLSGGSTYFKTAANKLKDLLKTVSRERSIRLLSFSDGEICEKNESMKILDEILNTNKTRHQMNSVSVRVIHGTEPDTEILMKLSTFSYPICDMTQFILDTDVEKDLDETVEKISKYFINDLMDYNLKLISDIILMSNEFSNNFSGIQYFNNNSVFRINSHRSADEYKKWLKIPNGKIEIIDCGELNENDFYDIMSKNAPYIAQRILERKVNNRDNPEKIKENQEIINYFKETEEYFESKRKKEIINLF